MDSSVLRDRVRQFKNVFASISKFQKNNPRSKANPEILKIGKGMALLLIAILLAWISKSETENRTRNEILQKEWPERQVWLGVLKQGGWTRSEKMDLSALLKNHPDPFSSEPMIWESEDHCFILLVGAEPELWSCATGQKKTTPKMKWHKIGSGYEGINRLALLVVPTVKKTVSYIDPKEIRY